MTTGTAQHSAEWHVAAIRKCQTGVFRFSEVIEIVFGSEQSKAKGRNLGYLEWKKEQVEFNESILLLIDLNYLFFVGWIPASIEN